MSEFIIDIIQGLALMLEYVVSAIVDAVLDRY